MFDNILRDLQANKSQLWLCGLKVFFFFLYIQLGERQNITHDKNQLIFEIQQISEIIILTEGERKVCEKKISRDRETNKERQEVSLPC